VASLSKSLPLTPCLRARFWQLSPLLVAGLALADLEGNFLLTMAYGR